MGKVHVRFRYHDTAHSEVRGDTAGFKPVAGQRRWEGVSRITSSSIWLLLILPLVMPLGCAGDYVGREYNQPPTAITDAGPNDRESSGKRIVVVGELVNPPKSSLVWPDIGSGMSDVLAKTLLNHSEFDVWLNPQLSERVDQALAGPVEQQRQRLDQIANEHSNVRFVITGRVTDFHHTSQLPKSLQRRNLVWKKKSEAVVAMQINIVDLDSRRLVASDHIYGIASAGREPVEQLYSGVSMGSYIFWSTPLGRASKQAVEKTMARLNNLVPTSDDSIRITRRIGDRRIQVAGGSETRLPEGREYYVCLVDGADGALRPVFDDVTDLPVRARIEQSGRLTSTAWLVGLPSQDEELRGAVLSPTMPRSTITVEARAPGK